MVGAEPEEVESFRIALSVATQRMIALSLGLLGVSAPDVDVGGGQPRKVGEVFVEALGIGGVGAGAGAPGAVGRRARGPPAPPGRVIASIADPEQHERRRQDVHGQVESVRGRLAEHRGPYWATSWRSICALVRPCAISPRMKLRSE